MEALSHDDQLHLDAAIGWIELGNHLEADAEVENITATYRMHPDVLEARWGIYAAAKKWDACFDIATTLTQNVSERVNGWLYLATTLRNMNETEKACSTLEDVAGAFNDNPEIPYEIACLLCDLGHLRDALDWLTKAFANGELKKLKLVALDEPRLQPLWEKIGQL